jgi:signal transduction histidine kinase
MPGSWNSGEREVAALICITTLVLVQFRVGETDRALAWAKTCAQQERREGRIDITDAAHDLVGGPFAALRRLTENRKSTDPDLWDALIQVDSGLRETLHLDRSATVTGDWPGLLIGRLWQIGGQFGIQVIFDPPKEPFAPEDREMARFVLEDLTVNAAKYGASLVEITLRRMADHYVADVRDDGPPFVPRAWMRTGGGLERLERKLTSRSGGLTLKPEVTSKVVTATWKSGRDMQTETKEAP